MEPLDYTLALDMQYYDVVHGIFMPKLVRLDHYRTFDEAFIRMRTMNPGHYNLNIVEKESLSYLISDAVIAANNTGQIAARLTKQPWSPETTDIRSNLYYETIRIDGGLSHMKEPLRSVTLGAHKDFANDRFVLGIYNGSDKKLMQSFRHYVEDLQKLDNTHYLSNHLFYYRSVTEAASRPEGASEKNDPAVEQYFHCAYIKEALSWMLFNVLGKPGTERKLSDTTLPRFNTLAVAATNEVIADVFLQASDTSSQLSGKGLYLSFRSGAIYADVAYEIPEIKQLVEERLSTTFKIASLADDGDTLIPVPRALSLRDNLLGLDQLEQKYRVRPPLNTSPGNGETKNRM